MTLSPHFPKAYIFNIQYRFCTAFPRLLHRNSITFPELVYFKNMAESRGRSIADVDKESVGNTKGPSRSRSPSPDRHKVDEWQDITNDDWKIQRQWHGEPGQDKTYVELMTGTRERSYSYRVYFDGHATRLTRIHGLPQLPAKYIAGIGLRENGESTFSSKLQVRELDTPTHENGLKLLAMLPSLSLPN